MRNFFLHPNTEPVKAAHERRQGPVSVHYAVAVDGVNAVKPPSRSYRRKGATFLREAAARPARHGICRHCSRRTWLSRLGFCRKDFLAGEGDISEVDFS